MAIQHTLPLFLIGTDSGIYTVIFNGDPSLPVYRTRGMAELFIRERDDAGLRPIEFATNESVVSVLSSMQSSVVNILWNPTSAPDGVMLSGVLETIRVYSTSLSSQEEESSPNDSEPWPP